MARVSCSFALNGSSVFVHHEALQPFAVHIVFKMPIAAFAKHDTHFIPLYRIQYIACTLNQHRRDKNAVMPPVFL